MIFTLIASLILIGFFSGYEIGFVSANRLSLELKKKQGNRAGKIIAGFLLSPTQFIGTCLIGLNISLVVFGILFEHFLCHYYSIQGLKMFRKSKKILAKIGLLPKHIQGKTFKKSRKDAQKRETE